MPLMPDVGFASDDDYDPPEHVKLARLAMQRAGSGD